MQLSVVLWLLTAPLAVAFYPNLESGGPGRQDYTDAGITEDGILRAVATFMEKYPLLGRPAFSPGQLVNLSPLTPATLFKEYYGGMAQIQTDQSGMYDSLQKPDIDASSLESAWLHAGFALHIIQKFYSNTNWVEMEFFEPYRHLVDPSSKQFPIVSRSQPTCRDCDKTPSGSSSQYVCEDNIIVDRLLTSGYKRDLCPNQSEGKCRHGGQKDLGQDDPPTGGINKETSDPALSPHHKLHQKAGQLAIKATADFFIGPSYGFLDRLGPDKFRKFFNLEGYSVAFVIDVSGSMGGEINDVKTICIEMLKKYQDSSDAPYNYVLVPFNDPDYGPVGITRNIDELQNMIFKLRANGGGDCPELAMTGLELALRNSMPRSQIFFFSDAGAKDKQKEDQVKILVETTKSKINVLLTGYCETRRKKRSPPVTSRQKRSSSKNIFEQLAEFSGGYYVQTQKGALANVLGLVEMALNAAPVKIFTAETEDQEVSFPVDEMLEEFSISVKSTASVVNLVVQQPSGTAATVTKLIDTIMHKAVEIAPIAERGEWKLRINGATDTYVIDISGKSLLDFSYQIMEEANGYTLPIQGRPVRGRNYTISIRVLSEMDDITIEKLLIFDENGKLQFQRKCQQTSHGKAVVKLEFPLTPSRLGISGRTGGGLNFTRVHANLISTEAVQVLRKVGESGVLSPGENTTVSVLVANEGNGMEFTFEVKDELGLLKDFSPKKQHLNPGQNITVTALFEAEGIHNSTSGMAIYSAKSQTAYNYVKIPITVIKQEILITDDEAPQYNITSYVGKCTADQQHSSDCSNYAWGFDFIMWDEGPTGLLTVQASNSDPSPRCSTLMVNVVKQYNCSIRLNCCSPSVHLLMMDEFGNAKELLVDTTIPITNGVNITAVVLGVVAFVLLVLAIGCCVYCFLTRKRQLV
ncbi:von Willebrand factor A domain-containing protein 7-like isoform X2 [Heterodontus francisci]|uniref:von Willebrand factor A domain-containing protein 7-like isoform X2 n=1 Tax=Heterodontus francisci TaxID=7792 RepID=UPI00355B00D7